MGRYFEELKRTMTFLGQKPETIFIGQAVGYPGTAVTNTLSDVSEDKKVELPVTEVMQMGISTGLALEGYLPISIYPRWNFLLLATDGIVNHLDKLPLYSGYNPKVIIRTVIGSERPLHPQLQHVGDFTEAFKLMCKTIHIERLDEPEQIWPAYMAALERPGSSILVEWGDYYGEK